MFKKIFWVIGIASLLTACGGGGNNANLASSVSVGGSGVKGPFAVGSSVKVCQLDTSTATCSSTSVSTTTIDKQGNFKANLSWTGWSEIEITGKSFNEDGNAETTSDLTLKAITNITGSDDAPIVNLFTHWISARIKTLIASESIANAYATAHSELQTEINLASAKTEALSPLVGSGSNVADNALLLLFSGAFHKIGGDASVLAQLTEDFADNGKFDKYQHMNNMRYASGAAGYLKKLHDNLVANDGTVSPPNESDIAATNPVKKTTDPLTAQQWHLSKVKAAEASSCATDAITCRGEGILVGVLDDGVEIAHEDLKDNIAYQKSRNYNVSDKNNANYYDPTPPNSTSEKAHAHGTAVAGLIAGVDNNGKGITGIASRSQIAGFNILNATAQSSAIADALGQADIMVSNNSWGSTDGTCAYQSTSSIEDNAINNAVTNGRGGKGTVVLFASGNGGDNCDNASSSPSDLAAADSRDSSSSSSVATGDQAGQDGRNNNHQVLSIGALHNDDKKAEYAERGSTTLVSAPAGNKCDSTNPALVTTDRSAENGYNKSGAANELSDINYTRCMNGTSGATPVVAGVVALMLQANPNLTWRDVRMILAETAQKNDSADADWKVSVGKKSDGSAFNVHPYYGYGMVDAKAAVALAKTWTLLPRQLVQTIDVNNQVIITDSGNFTNVTLKTFGAISSDTTPHFTTLETVEIMVTFDGHQRIGDLQFDLIINTDGTETRETLVGLNSDTRDTSIQDGQLSFTFTSVQHLGRLLGNTTLSLAVADKQANGKTGSVTINSMTLRGYIDQAVMATVRYTGDKQ